MINLQGIFNYYATSSKLKLGIKIMLMIWIVFRLNISLFAMVIKLVIFDNFLVRNHNSQDRFI